MKRIIAPLLCLLLAACIDVEDFSDSWDKGITDPCISAIAEMDIDGTVRVLSLGGSHFIMVKAKPADKGGSIIRFAINHGDYVAYSLNEKKRESFAVDYPDSGVVLTNETATIPLLDHSARALLQSVAARKDYWQESDRKPYNPSHNPACRL